MYINLSNQPIESPIFFCMGVQLFKGDTLTEWLDYSSNETLHIKPLFSQIINAIEYIHKNNIVHQNLHVSSM